MQYSNPRLHAEFDNWPCGGKVVKCQFAVEYNGNKGSRVARTTTDKSGLWCKPKYTTYAKRSVIVDGEDGRTYILQQSMYGVTVLRSDFMDQENQMGNDPERLKYLMGMILEAWEPT